VALCEGETARALALFGESESNYRALGDVEGARMAVLSRARILAESGKAAQALGALDALLLAVRGMSAPQPILEGEVLLARAGACELEGRFEEALTDARLARERFAEAQFQLSENGAGLYLGQLATTAFRLTGRALPAGHLAELRALAERALVFSAPTAEIMARCTLADALVAHGEPEEGAQHGQQGLTRARELDFRDGEARALEVLARAEGDREKALEAFRLWLDLDCPTRAERLSTEWLLLPEERNRA
jgi:tetratricopeptide (TPR) repeat protein